VRAAEEIPDELSDFLTRLAEDASFDRRTLGRDLASVRGFRAATADRTSRSPRFVDTNVLLYAVSKARGDAGADCAAPRTELASDQVLLEFYVQATVDSRSA
jgi:hypothetical protein